MHVHDGTHLCEEMGNNAKSAKRQKWAGIFIRERGILLYSLTAPNANKNDL